MNRWFNPPPGAGRAVPIIAARVDDLHDGRAQALWALLGTWPLLLEALRTTAPFDGVPAGVAPPLTLDSLRALPPGVLAAAVESAQTELAMLRDAKRCFLSDFLHGGQAALRFSAELCDLDPGSPGSLP